MEGYFIKTFKPLIFVFFSLYVEEPSTNANFYEQLCYPANIEKEILEFIEEVSKKHNLLDSK